jgi:NitT/TauT family transport system ATP-binding protein
MNVERVGIADLSASSDRPATTSDVTGPSAEPAQPGTIDLDGVGMRYRSAAGDEVVAVRDVSFHVSAGTFLSIVGPSGCGKTSLLMAIAGLRPATDGTITIGGSVVTGPRPSTTGIVFQESNLLNWRSVIRNVALPLEVAGVDKALRLDRAKEALALVGLEGAENRYPHELSGGMRHRVALARGLVTDPAVLLMDEPFAALDEQTRYKMGAELLKIWDRLSTTVVFITHSLSEAVFLSDEVIAMGGRPGSISDRFAVHFERPRDLDLMATSEFAQLRGRLYTALESSQ